MRRSIEFFRRASRSFFVLFAQRIPQALQSLKSIKLKKQMISEHPIQMKKNEWWHFVRCWSIWTSAPFGSFSRLTFFTDQILLWSSSPTLTFSRIFHFFIRNERIKWFDFGRGYCIFWIPSFVLFARWRNVLSWMILNEHCNIRIWYCCCWGKDLCCARWRLVIDVWKWKMDRSWNHHRSWSCRRRWNHCIMIYFWQTTAKRKFVCTFPIIPSTLNFIKIFCVHWTEKSEIEKRTPER